MIYYTAVILIVIVDGFFIPCKTVEDCKTLQEFGFHECIENYCITHDYFLEDMIAPSHSVSVPTAPTTTTTTTTVTTTTTTTVTTTMASTTTAPTAPTTTTTTTAAATRATLTLLLLCCYTALTLLLLCLYS